jgi:succinate dehydrogenase flavin-adding protein (antitoxin of CptAB toxin-antitoxin module)
MGKYKFIEERVETMSSSELKIFLNILKSRSKELMSTLESVRGIKDLEAVCKSTQKLNNRVSEFDGGSFLILVARISI